MKLHVLLLIAFAVGIAACGEKEQAAAPIESEVDAPEAVATEMPGAETLEAVEDELDVDSDATLADVQEWRTEALLDHMHAHAEQLDDLNYALDDGDLDRASMAAYWLSRHETIAGLPDSLQPFVAGLRDSARAVEAAEDLDGARAAAKGVGEACQACHDAADVGPG
jgi:cytochrome c556